jgi:MFS family permease
MDTTVMQTPQLSKGRLVLLGTSSVILCLSFVMSVFAPFPIALAVILYGRALGILTGLAGLVATFAFAQFLYRDLTLFGFYGCVLIFGFAIAEVVLRNLNPIKGIVVFGLAFIVTVTSAGALFLKSRNVTVEQFIVQQMEMSKDKIEQQKKAIEQSTDKDSIQVLQLLDNPKLLATELKESFPSYFFMGVFLMLWFNTFLALKSRRLLLSAQDYPYSEKNLLNFKVPFALVPVLIAGFVLAIWGNDFGYGNLEPVGLTIIKCLGIFYFFQGFGVMSDLLTFLGIMGFFRSIMVMVVILMANYLIAAAGLFDNWFDFRKYFVKRKTDLE